MNRLSPPIKIGFILSDDQGFLDFQCVKLAAPSWFDKIKSFFFGGNLELKASYNPVAPFGSFEDKASYDPEVHGSDHLPVFVTYHTMVRPSLPRRIAAFILGIFNN